MYELFQTIWHRSADGYEWQPGRFTPISGADPCEGPLLTAVGGTLQPYKPDTGLFLKFASVEPDSDDDILRFANQYGLLGGASLWQAPEHKRKGEIVTGITGEPSSYWQEHLQDMKAAVSLWEAIHSENTDLLTQCIRWQGTDHITYDWPPSSDWETPWSIHATIASRLEPELLKRFKPGDVVMPARIYLQEIVNKRLAKFVAPRLLWSLSDRSKMGLYIVPDTLIGCLWIQLAMAIAEFRKFRLCEGCKKPMLVAPEGSGYRTNRKTCSNACRIRVYSRRKDEARRLKGQKLSVREIAKRLDTEVEQIKKWIVKR